MATAKKSIPLDIVKNTDAKSAQYGKFYARIHSQEPLSLRGLIEHIMTHGSQYTRDVVTGIVIRLRDCMVELLSEGTPIKLDGIGTFRPTLANEKGGATSLEAWNVEEHAKGLHIRFIPEGEKFDRLTSKAFLSQCQLEKKYEVTYQTYQKDGKTYKKPTFTPIGKGTEVEPVTP